ncbi:MAG TPA: pyridoxamine 5'-phosphate oxidase family protein [Candidatus Dormibacteraeota bacterium]|nr:pyridoxamine 5'-phosphate oxidase family protein [Candidatus Dormibacteraeota bacterium]
MANHFHEGERAVQQRAGVAEMAARIGNSIHAEIPPRAREFLDEQPFVVLASRDADGRVWASVIAGEPGFLDAPDERTLAIAATPAPDDPLAAVLAVGAPLGVLVIDPATRRRLRINGVVAAAGPPLRLTVGECFANCPKYIQQRELRPAGAARGGTMRRTATLALAQQERIARADTFFIASQHPRAGLDVSHRGGNPGFIDVIDAGHLAWPDYTGNGMFQTLGNLTSEPRAGLLFIDFAGGDVLQLTGRGRVDFDPQRARRYAGAERVVEFAIDEVRDTAGLVPLRGGQPAYSPYNP